MRVWEKNCGQGVDGWVGDMVYLRQALFLEEFEAVDSPLNLLHLSVRSLGDSVNAG